MTVDPFSLLEKDHRHVERLLGVLAESEPGAERAAAVAELVPALSVHMQFEEAAIYPLVQRHIGAEAAMEANIEHGLTRDGLTKLVALQAAPGFGAVVEMVKGGISHHVEEEETELFPALRKKVKGDDAEALSTALLAAKRAAGLPPIDVESATKDELVAAARNAGVEVSTSMTKEQVKAALAG